MYTIRDIVNNRCGILTSDASALADAPRGEIRACGFSDAIMNLLRQQQVEMDETPSGGSSNLTSCAAAAGGTHPEANSRMHAHCFAKLIMR